MLFLVSLAIGLIAGLVTRGSLLAIGGLQVRWPAIVVIALLVRFATVLTPLRHVDGIQYLYAISFLVLVGWCIWNLQRIRGVWIVTIGAALNLVVIAANAGRMPVSASAAGVATYTPMTASTHLNWLGDWIVVGRPTWGVYSPGDLIISIGVVIVTFLLTRQTGETRPRIVSDPP